MDHKKLVKAGFRIFRKEENIKVIKELVLTNSFSGGQSHGWSYYGRYDTKKAMNEAFAELMKDDKNIEG